MVGPEAAFSASSLPSPNKLRLIFHEEATRMVGINTWGMDKFRLWGESPTYPELALSVNSTFVVAERLRKLGGQRHPPRVVMEVGNNSARSPLWAMWAATSFRVLGASERGSMKTMTDGPAPLSATPRTPGFPLNC
jgi:hypothetical protein